MACSVFFAALLFNATFESTSLPRGAQAAMGWSLEICCSSLFSLGSHRAALHRETK